MSYLSSGSLFDRLRGPRRAIKRASTKERAAEKARLIRKQLEFILNSRKGSSASAPDFGLMDFNDAANHINDLGSVMAEDISTAIQRYEPRIQLKKVEYKEATDDSPLLLNFAIHGVVAVDDHYEKLAFDIQMDCLTKQYLVNTSTE